MGMPSSSTSSTDPAQRDTSALVSIPKGFSFLASPSIDLENANRKKMSATPGSMSRQPKPERKPKMPKSEPKRRASDVSKPKTHSR